MNPGDVAQSVLPLTSSDLSLITLFLHAHFAGFLTRAEMMPGLSVRADKHAAANISPELAAPKFECARGDKLEVIEMRMN